MSDPNVMPELIPIKFIEKVEEVKNTVTLKFQVPPGFTWQEGTHFHVAFKGFEQEVPIDKDKVRTYSIMSLEEEGYIGMTTRIKDHSSDFKKALVALEAGDEVLMFKIGSRMGLRREGKPIVMITMGVGIATLRPVIKTFLKQSEGLKSVVNINVDSSGQVVYQEEFDAMEDERVTNHFVQSRKALYQAIDAYVTGEEALYYVVGSDEFLSHICDYLLDKGVDKDNLVIDKNPKKRVNFIK